MTDTKEIENLSREIGGYSNRFDDVYARVSRMLISQAKRIAELEAALLKERDECCSIVYGQCSSDNTAERTVRAIRARALLSKETRRKLTNAELKALTE